MKTTRLIPARFLAVLLLGILLAACGDSDGAVEPTTATTSTTQATTTTEAVIPGFPVTVETANGSITLEEPPAAIVSISPTSTEVLYAIGAGEMVVAVDDQSNYPAGAPVTDLSGFSSSAEAIAAYEPDLVFISFDPGELVSGLDALGIPTVVHGAAFNLDDAFRQISEAGALTGKSDEAAAVVGGIQEKLDTLIATLEEERAGLDQITYYHELDNTYYSVTSATFVGELYDRLGLANIADPADADGFGYPQLSEEFIVEANPDLIFLADTKCCGQTAQTVAERPGWGELSAVQSELVFELDDDVASRWGPRIGELLDQIAAAVITFE